MEPTSVDCAYAAGIIDGEGSICIRKVTRPLVSPWAGHRMSVTVSNSHLGVLEWMSDRWATANVNRGKVKPHHRQMYQLQWQSDGAIKVLRDLLPYLIIKREQARLAIDFQALLESNHRKNLTAEIVQIRDVYRVRMSALNSGQSSDLSMAEEATGTEG